MIPTQGDILKRWEASRNKTGLFQGQRDFDAQNRWVKEQVEKLGGAVHLFVTSTQRGLADGPLESAGVDPLYGDVLDPEWFADGDSKDQQKFNFRCLIEHQPSKQSLKRYGIEETRDVIFHFPFDKLKDEGLVTEVRHRGVDIGDIIEWDSTLYIVLSAHRESYFGQTVSNYFTSAACMRYKFNAVPTADTPEVCE
jgi:hypothetical protein